MPVRVIFQALRPPAGSVELKISPPTAIATQNDVDGQDTPYTAGD
ncbi:MAG: hypothetical protein ACYC91_12395 [Solirubrobacteraceae bacterium]